MLMLIILFRTTLPVFRYFGLPLHLVRELYITFYTLKERLNKFLRYRRLAKALEERFPDASPEVGRHFLIILPT